MKKFNVDSTAAATAATYSAVEASGTTIPEKKTMPKKPKASVPKEQLPQKAAPVPKPSTGPQSSQPQQKQIVKHHPAHSSSSVPSATSSATKSSPPLLKTKMTTGRGIRPSPRKVINVPCASEGSEEFYDEALQAIIRNKQE